MLFNREPPGGGALERQVVVEVPEAPDPPAVGQVTVIVVADAKLATPIAKKARERIFFITYLLLIQ
jgi:hypothetical protein